MSLTRQILVEILEKLDDANTENNKFEWKNNHAAMKRGRAHLTEIAKLCKQARAAMLDRYKQAKAESLKTKSTHG